DASPCLATSAAVASRVASRTARRFSSIVSVHSFGTQPAYRMPAPKHSDLTVTDCLDKTGDRNPGHWHRRLSERTSQWLIRLPTPLPATALAPRPAATRPPNDRAGR